MSLPFGRRILVLAPHPDDEVVGACAAILRARAAGARVWTLFLTNGCVEPGAMWPWARRLYPQVVARRRAEAEAAAALIGCAPAGWAARPARHLWRELPQAEAELRGAVSSLGVDQLWVPAFEGGNPDHDAANALASRLAAEGIGVLEFAEYNLAGGRIFLNRFPAESGGEIRLALTPHERAIKLRAMALYASERANLIVAPDRREAFRPLAAYDYARPPHEGKLWYARFQWVPFRHPRVDFTQPAEVYAAISAHLGRRAPASLS